MSFGGLKPIAIMLEDFDNNGKLQNSVPIQFTAGKSSPARDLDQTSEGNIPLKCEKNPTLKTIGKLPY